MKVQSKDDIICMLYDKLKQNKLADRTYEQRRRGWIESLEWVLKIENNKKDEVDEDWCK
jgi:hypothetical protein|tara:strand:- start:423 stop:599 length:177 start_codon:yes stop_codon:yes gene_type:complete